MKKNNLKTMCRKDCLKAIDELKKEGYSSVEIYNNEDFGVFYIDNADKYVDALGDDAVFDILYGLLEKEMDKDFQEEKLTPEEDEWYAKHMLVDALSKMAISEGKFVKLYNQANESGVDIDDLLMAEYPEIVKDYYAE